MNSDWYGEGGFSPHRTTFGGKVVKLGGDAKFCDGDTSPNWVWAKPPILGAIKMLKLES